MGRIKTQLIKRATQEVFEAHKAHNEVATDFTKNKQVLPRLVQLHSKKMRNVVAGYLTRLAKQSEKSI